MSFSYQTSSELNESMASKPAATFPVPAALEKKTEEVHPDQNPSKNPPAWTELPDLAYEDVGGQVLYETDQFFGPSSWLLKKGRGEFYPGRFTEQGQYMEGWETRRHNYPNHDWCIIRLGLSGIIKGVDIDTNHFTGNNAEYASEELLKAEWTEILPKSKLEPGTPDKGHNYFEIKSDQRWTHVKLHNYPDGGIARFRVYGEVVPAWERYDADDTINLAGIEFGAVVLASSNSYYSRKDNLIMPGRGKNMGDGWETRRRRGPGHDWAVLKFGTIGTLKNIIIDTAHFKGNFPEGCLLKDGESWENATWTEILPRTKMSAHKEHHFVVREELRKIPFNYVRLNVYPDGGISRLRIFGKRVIDSNTAKVEVKPVLSPEESIKAVELNQSEYSPFGNVIEARPQGKQTTANQGTAQRFNHLTTLENLRPNAKANVCVFRCQPRSLPFDIKLLEKHPHSTQMFIPMTAERRYLVIVAQGGDKPDLSTLKAFVAGRGQGITYHPGIWHHPMIALDNETDFACVVHEDGTSQDCVEFHLEKTIRCIVP